MKAQDILDHCKAVCEGRIPQSLPFWVERNADGPACYAINDGPPDPDGIENPTNIMYIHFQENDMTPTDWRIAARLLGLDRPAPVVLEWKYREDGGEWSARFNPVISAFYTANSHGCTVCVTFYNRNIECKWFPTEAQARAWCVEQITKIITPTK